MAARRNSECGEHAVNAKRWLFAIFVKACLLDWIRGIVYINSKNAVNFGMTTEEKRPCRLGPKASLVCG